MPRPIVRRIKPEEEELTRKREELAGIRATLAEHELDLVDLRTQLAAFEGRYLRLVGTLYAELDEWKARIAELRARLHPSAASQAQAEQAWEQARQTYEDAHGEASESRVFVPSPELKRMYREAAKRIHPDFAVDPADRERRTGLMADANRAYEAGDAETLQQILDRYEEGAEANLGEGIGGELIRIIRQISEARERISAIEHEIATLLRSEIAQMKQDAEQAQQQGRDLLAELANSISLLIQHAQAEYESLTQEAGSK
jgi:chromosome segregation ATPase